MHEPDGRQNRSKKETKKPCKETELGVNNLPRPASMTGWGPRRMNREGFESSTESECGGMYSKAAQVRSDEVNWDVQTDVNYKCGIKAPAKSNTRRKVRVKEKLVDKKPKRSKVDRRRREGKLEGDRMPRKVQASKEATT